MKRTKLSRLAAMIAIVLTIGAASAWAIDGNMSLPTYGKQNEPLPRDDIKRFVTAIAAIQHYYIKDVPVNKLFNNSIRGMVSNLDPHSSYLDPDAMKELDTAVSGKFVGVGIELTTFKGALKVISPLEGTPASKAGIKPGDLIIKVDGKLIQNMTLTEAINHIKGKRGTKVDLTILRKNQDKPVVLSLTRDVIKVVSVKDKMLENGYGYIRITFFQGPVDKNLAKAIRKLKKQSGGKLKGLVLDLRNNPGGLLDVSGKVADTFLSKNDLKRYNGLLVYTKGRIKGSDIKLHGKANDMIGNAPLVVLINGGSASASEIVAGALQDYKRAIIMGTRSFGKGSVQTIIPIGPKSALKLTTALYYTPAGRVIQAKGIQPDVVVPELKVDEKDIAGLVDIDESDYLNHIDNDKASRKKEQARLDELRKQRKAELTLAKEDYQLYESLMMLKGMSAIQNSGRS